MDQKAGTKKRMLRGFPAHSLKKKKKHGSKGRKEEEKKKETRGNRIKHRWERTLPGALGEVHKMRNAGWFGQHETRDDWLV